MVVPAFGFSAGDFVSAIDILGKAVKALRETSGATTQFQQATLELDILQSVLLRVQALQPTNQNGDIIQKIQFCALTCHVPLANFVHKIEKFNKHLGREQPSQNTTNVMKRLSSAMRKIDWATSLEPQVMSVKAQIGPQIAIIEALLQLESLERIDRVSTIAMETHQRANDVLQSVDGLKALVRTTYAAQDQATELRPLIETIATRQSDVNASLSELARATESFDSYLKARLDVQEGLMKLLIDRTGILQPGPPEPILTGDNDCIAPGTDWRQQPQSNRFSMLLRAIRGGLLEIVFMLYCLLPGAQHLFRTLKALGKAPTLLLQDNIRLEGALGRTMSLPYEHFRHWDVFQARLRASFRNISGERKVERGQFLILDMRSGEILHENVWESALNRRTRLAMSMLYSGSDFGGLLCPRCHLVAPPVPHNAIMQCPSCNLNYRWRDGLLLGNALHSNEPVNADTSTSLQEVNIDIDMRLTTASMQTFQRIHLVDIRSELNPDPAFSETFTSTSETIPAAHLEQNLEQPVDNKYTFKCQVCEATFNTLINPACHMQSKNCDELPVHGSGNIRIRDQHLADFSLRYWTNSNSSSGIESSAEWRNTASKHKAHNRRHRGTMNKDLERHLVSCHRDSHHRISR